MNVYVLQHERELEDDSSDVKMIGVYGSEGDALAAQQRLSTAPGFREHCDGFSIDVYELGQDCWTEGFEIVRSDDGGTGSATQAA